jgi:hypothetical protein
MARGYGYGGGGGRSVDTSAIDQLGDTAMREFQNIVLLTQREKEMNLARRQQAAYEAQQRAEMAQEAQRMKWEREDQYKAMEQADADRAIQLVTEVGLDPYAAAALAPRMPGNMMPLLDALAKRRKDQEKAAQAAEEQQTNRGLLAQSDIGSLPQESVPGLAGAAGINPDVLLALVEAKRRSDASKIAAEEAKWERNEARKDARARVRGSGGGIPVDEKRLRAQADDELKLRKQWVAEVKPIFEATGNARSALAVADQPVTTGTAQIIRDNNLVNAYAKLLQRVGIVTDLDYNRAAGNVPGVLGSAQQFITLATSGSTLDGPRREEIKKNMRLLARYAERRAKDSQSFIARNARKRGLDPDDIFSEDLIGEEPAAPPQPGAPSGQAWDLNYP